MNMSWDINLKGIYFYDFVLQDAQYNIEFTYRISIYYYYKLVKFHVEHIKIWKNYQLVQFAKAMDFYSF